MRSPGPAFDLREALTKELRAASEELDAFNERPQAAHRCRVRLKRARALARIGRAGAPGLFAVFNDSARTVMRSLARARDLEALSEAARDIATKQRRRDAAALEAVAGAIDIEKAAAPAFDLKDAQSGLRDLVALAQVWPEASARQIRRGAKRVIRRARDAWRHGRDTKDAERRHAWRKREKDRFYTALILDDAWPDRRQRKLGKELGEVLGNERDATLLLDRLASDPPPNEAANASDRTLRAIKRRRRKLARRADELGADLHRHGV